MFCQNHEISQEGKGIEITVERLAEIFIEQQNRGVKDGLYQLGTIWSG